MIWLLMLQMLQGITNLQAGGSLPQDNGPQDAYMEALKKHKGRCPTKFLARVIGSGRKRHRETEKFYLQQLLLSCLNKRQ